MAHFTLCAKNISIKNQQDFDRLNSLIIDAITSGEDNIFISFGSGQFIFKDTHLLLSNINNPRLKIRLKGHNTFFIPEGIIYQNGDIYDDVFSPDNSWMNHDKSIDNWSQVRFSDGLIEIVDINKKTCRLKSKESLHDIIGNCSYIKIPHWFQSSVYQIDSIKNNYIYFVANDLSVSKSKGTINLNDDFNKYGKPIRYKLWNVVKTEESLSVTNGIINLPNSMSVVRCGESCCFLSVKNCNINSFCISGIEIRGSSNIAGVAVISLDSINAQGIIIKECVFNGLINDAVSLANVVNTSISNCSFFNCWKSCIISDNLCENINIKNNIFETIGGCMLNTFSVSCSGDGYLIEDNVFRNFGYGGISVGVWYGYKKHKTVRGIVQNNVFVFTKEYIDKIDNTAIMDGGAIYVFTKHDKTIIRGNYINGYTGMASNRGVFCDDGAYNIQIYGNVVLNTPNDYSIESRRVSVVEDAYTKNSGIAHANVNVTIKDNIIDGAILFKGNEEIDNHCYYGGNYFINDSVSNVLKYVNMEWSDVYLSNAEKVLLSIKLSKQDYKMIKKSPSWRWLSRYVCRK